MKKLIKSLSVCLNKIIESELILVLLTLQKKLYNRDKVGYYNVVKNVNLLQFVSPADKRTLIFFFDFSNIS